MTIPSPAPPQVQNKSWFRSMRLTRTSAWLMSLFGPALLLVPLLLVAIAMRAFQADGEGNDVLGLVGMLLFVAAVVTMQVYFARWYALDKGRSRAWGIAGPYFRFVLTLCYSGFAVCFEGSRGSVRLHCR